MEPGTRIGQVMQYTNGKSIVELARERQVINIGLDDVRVGQRSRSDKGCFDRDAEIDTNHVACAPACGELGVPAFAATAFEHDLVAEEFRRHRRDPTEKLFRVAFVFLCEVLPLPTETGGGRALVTLDVFEISETRNTGGDGERRRAGRATQFAFDDLAVFGFGGGKRE